MPNYISSCSTTVDSMYMYNHSIIFFTSKRLCFIGYQTSLYYHRCCSRLTQCTHQFVHKRSATQMTINRLHVQYETAIIQRDSPTHQAVYSNAPSLNSLIHNFPSSSCIEFLRYHRYTVIILFQAHDRPQHMEYKYDVTKRLCSLLCPRQQLYHGTCCLYNIPLLWVMTPVTKQRPTRPVGSTWTKTGQSHGACVGVAVKYRTGSRYPFVWSTKTFTWVVVTLPVDYHRDLMTC